MKNPNQTSIFNENVCKFLMHEIFFYSLTRLVQTGLINKWKKDEVSKLDSTNYGGEKKRNLSITLEQTQAIFFIIFIGYVISMICFVIELFLGKKQIINNL